jgi:phosphatidylinositol alpha-1,6-mannosyltransferase
VTSRALLLAMSRGLGGGIERYVETLEWAFDHEGVDYQRVDLCSSGFLAQARMLVEARRYLQSDGDPTRLVLVHPNLLPAGLLLARDRRVAGVSIVCHGCEVWGRRLRLRRYLERFLMRSSAVRVVTASSFTAGALADSATTTILPPGLSQEWFDTLMKASTDEATERQGVALVTAFRLEDWRDKGLPQLLDAVAALGRADVQVIVCGSGVPSEALLQLVGKYEQCVLRPGLTDGELARQLAAADLFVLATRTRGGRRPFGEGFGLVLLEAQLAGTPVIAPAHGGSHDAFVDQVTGVAPVDQSAGALTDILAELLRDRCALQQMGRRAAEWARESFAPELYASRVVRRLL